MAHRIQPRAIVTHEPDLRDWGPGDPSLEELMNAASHPPADPREQQLEVLRGWERQINEEVERVAALEEAQHSGRQAFRAAGGSADYNDGWVAGYHAAVKAMEPGFIFAMIALPVIAAIAFVAAWVSHP